MIHAGVEAEELVELWGVKALGPSDAPFRGDEGVRLELLDQVVGCLRGEGIEILDDLRRGVEPDAGDVAVVREEFGDLIVDEFLVDFHIVLLLAGEGEEFAVLAHFAKRLTLWGVRVTPVTTVGVIGEEAEALLITLLDEFTDEVPLAGGVERVEGSVLGIEHTEAVMVTARKGDVLHPGLESDIGDVIGIKLFGGEGLGELAIFLLSDAVLILHPFALFHEAVDAVMHEEPVLRFAKPFGRSRQRVLAVEVCVGLEVRGDRMVWL